MLRALGPLGRSARRQRLGAPRQRQVQHRRGLARASVALRQRTGEVETEYVAWDEAGHALIASPIYNKGSAFTEHERDELGLRGLLPPHVETLEEQMTRCYQSYKYKTTDMERHIYLRQLQDTNEVLFYALLQRHVVEMLPIVYTPTVGLACQKHSDIYRRPRGVFLSYPQRASMRLAFESLVARGHSGAPVDVDTALDVQIIVVTDGSRILGLGDLGANGAPITVGKCSLYTALGGIPGPETLPIFLDVGTDNKEALENPNYIGWRHARLKGVEYFAFVDEFVQLVKEFFPHAMLQWEDFNIDVAIPLLNKYRGELCSFNDDNQGTAAIATGALLAACEQAGTPLSQQKVVMVGSGSAGCGIAWYVMKAMMEEGLTKEEARSRFFMVDRPGLLHDGIDELRDFQRVFVQPRAALEDWAGGDGTSFSLLEVVRNAKPGIMLGVSGMPGLFTEEVVKEMALHCERPIIFPLSNPTSRAEARPADVMAWSENRAIVATGTAFPPTEVEVSRTSNTRTIKSFEHSQANNSLLFPGLGLAHKVVGATRITDSMLLAAARAIATCSPVMKTGDKEAALLPPLDCIVDVSKRVAFEAGRTAIEQGVATKLTDVTKLQEAIEDAFWAPQYKNVRLAQNMWTDKKK